MIPFTKDEDLSNLPVNEQDLTDLNEILSKLEANEVTLIGRLFDEVYRTGLSEGITKGTEDGFKSGVRRFKQVINGLIITPEGGFASEAERQRGAVPLRTSLSEFGLKPNILRALRKDDIYTLGHLLRATTDQLADIRGIGPVTMGKLMRLLADAGYPRDASV